MAGDDLLRASDVQQLADTYGLGPVREFHSHRNSTYLLVTQDSSRFAIRDHGVTDLWELPDSDSTIDKVNAALLRHRRYFESGAPVSELLLADKAPSVAMPDDAGRERLFSAQRWVDLGVQRTWTERQRLARATSVGQTMAAFHAVGWRRDANAPAKAFEPTFEVDELIEQTSEMFPAFTNRVRAVMPQLVATQEALQSNGIRTLQTEIHGDSYHGGNIVTGRAGQRPILIDLLDVRVGNPITDAVRTAEDLSDPRELGTGLTREQFVNAFFDGYLGTVAERQLECDISEVAHALQFSRAQSLVASISAFNSPDTQVHYWLKACETGFQSIERGFGHDLGLA